MRAPVAHLHCSTCRSVTKLVLEACCVVTRSVTDSPSAPAGMQRTQPGDAVELIITPAPASRRRLQQRATYSTLVLQGQNGGQRLGAGNSPDTLMAFNIRHLGRRFNVTASAGSSAAVIFDGLAVWAPFQRFERLWQLDLKPYITLDDSAVVCFVNSCAPPKLSRNVACLCDRCTGLLRQSAMLRSELPPARKLKTCMLLRACLWLQLLLCDNDLRCLQHVSHRSRGCSCTWL